MRATTIRRAWLAIPVLLATAAGSAKELDEMPEPDCARNVVVTGYWPPTNEMLRQWSTDPGSNPSGWNGRDWRGHGFDVYAYFPEFPPDGVPFNDPFGSAGFIGSADSDFRVDYQDTSADFWRIMKKHRPVILVTTSRGGSIGWEVEAWEGGHGGGGDPATDWIGDGNPPETLPTQDSIARRSWQAISTFRAGRRLPSALPMEDIVAAAESLGLTSVAIDEGTSGNYLSGFMGLHGLYYNHINRHNVAAGHIHVGGHVAPEDARRLMEVSLEAVLERFDAGSLACSKRRGKPPRPAPSPKPVPKPVPKPIP